MEQFSMLDAAAYEPGALPVATKELPGLVAALMKDCEKCVHHHLERCRWTEQSDDVTFAGDEAQVPDRDARTVPLGEVRGLKIAAGTAADSIRRVEGRKFTMSAVMGR